MKKHYYLWKKFATYENKYFSYYFVIECFVTIASNHFLEIIEFSKIMNYVFLKNTRRKMESQSDFLEIQTVKKNFRYILLKLNFFSNSKPKAVYLPLFLSSLSFSKFWGANFMYFRHKQISRYVTAASTTCYLLLFFFGEEEKWRNLL